MKTLPSNTYVQIQGYRESVKNGMVTRDRVEVIRNISDKFSDWTSSIEKLNLREREEQNSFLREIKFAGNT
jgi:hypothetical protein